MEPVVITGAALGLPGVDRIFDDDNVARILSGQQFIDVIPRQLRREMVDKHITRLVKSERGEPVFETIGGEEGVIKLAGRYAPFDAVEEFGIDPDRDAALDACTRLAIGAGIDALRDAGIPLVRHYHTTTLGTQLPGALGTARRPAGRHRRGVRLGVPRLRVVRGRHRTITTRTARSGSSSRRSMTSAAG